MSKQRGTFFGLMSKAVMLISALKWHGKATDKKENQKYRSPIFIPKRGKFKGYMKENKRSTFNKNR